MTTKVWQPPLVKTYYKTSWETFYGLSQEVQYLTYILLPLKYPAEKTTITHIEMEIKLK